MTRSLAVVAAAAGSVLVADGVKASEERPHIVHVVLDDYGWADAGWHRPPGYTDVQTPNLDSLVKEGVELDRHYVYQVCSPTRTALQSGRNPAHVNVVNDYPYLLNPNDPVSGYSAMPRNMTGMAEHMRAAGYSTHMYGKWDAGMATPQHTPKGRGYDHSLFYFHHFNDYWNNTAGLPCNNEQMVDLWDDDLPARGTNNSQTCSQENQAPECVYEDSLFLSRATAAVQNASMEGADPLFMFWAPHIVHDPLQVPSYYVERFASIQDTRRRLYHAMVYYIDEAIGNFTSVVKSTGLWNKTLIIAHADNGGPIYIGGGANNYPLKGGKVSNWEGGIRVNAFATGGYLPRDMVGKKLDGLMCGWDWYTTFAALAGVEPTDPRAAKARLPPIDGVNLWPYLSGQVPESPRKEILLGDSIYHRTLLGGLIKGNYKILFGNQSMSGWTGPQYPNVSSHWNPSETFEYCGNTSATGCLFDIYNDPTEHVNLAASNPELYNEMQAAAMAYEPTLFSPDRGHYAPAACEHALSTYDGFWGPFVDLDSKP